MLELLFLLMPVAAAYGWYMGQRGVRLDNQQSSHKLSRNYVAGINFLLSDQPDKAVDLFIELLQVDEETLETHMALGNLFRQRGEVRSFLQLGQYRFRIGFSFGLNHAVAVALRLSELILMLVVP